MCGCWSRAASRISRLNRSGPRRLGQVGVKDLERDRAVVPEVMGEVHRSHATVSQLAVEHVPVAERVGRAVGSVTVMPGEGRGQTRARRWRNASTRAGRSGPRRSGRSRGHRPGGLVGARSPRSHLRMPCRANGTGRGLGTKVSPPSTPRPSAEGQVRPRTFGLSVRPDLSATDASCETATCLGSTPLAVLQRHDGIGGVGPVPGPPRSQAPRRPFTGPGPRGSPELEA